VSKKTKTKRIVEGVIRPVNWDYVISSRLTAHLAGAADDVGKALATTLAAFDADEAFY